MARSAKSIDLVGALHLPCTKLYLRGPCFQSGGEGDSTVTEEAKLAALVKKLGPGKVVNIVTLALAASWYAEVSMAALSERERSVLYVSRLYDGLDLMRDVFRASSVDDALIQRCTDFVDRYFTDRIDVAGPTH
jgi:hypothetical protein